MVWFLLAPILVLAGYLAHQFPIFHTSTAAGLASLVLFSAPVIWVVLKKWGWRSMLVAVTTLAVLALTIETFAVWTGWPYSQFAYHPDLSLKILETTPLLVGLAWPGVLLSSWVLTHRLTNSITRVILTTTLLVWYDLLLDPVAVNWGIWSWAEPGGWFGIPVQNYLGWVLSGIVGTTTLEVLKSRLNRLLITTAADRFLAAQTLLWSAAFWAGVAAAIGWWLLAVLGIGLIVTIHLYTRS